MYRYLLRLSGEISLKGSMRGALEQMLVRNIIRTIGSDITYIRTIDGGRIYVEASKEISEALSRFFGVVEVLEVYVESSKDLEMLSRRIRELLCNTLSGKRFAVRVRRAGATGYTSMDAARIIGSMLLECSEGVDLENPGEIIYVEIRGDRAYISISSMARKGFGGLPLGSSEKVLSLFSGGFDSPVATWMVMKRGSPADLLHYVMGSIENSIRALRVGEVLIKRWSLGYGSKAYAIDFSEIVLEIRSKIKRRLWQPSLRRAMYVVGEMFLERIGAEALVTGESIWEASSQRLRALHAAQKGLDALILRPLIGFDKAEIMRLSMELGFYEHSSKVVESCFIGSPSPPDLDPGELLSEFSKIDRSVFERAIEGSIEINYQENWEEKLLSSLKTTSFSIETIPEGYVVVDISRRKGYGPIKGLEDLEKLLEKREKLVLVCEMGEASEALARHLREQGYDVYSLKGGLKTLRQILNIKST